jgi:hypothetical protein
MGLLAAGTVTARFGPVGRAPFRADEQGASG